MSPTTSTPAPTPAASTCVICGSPYLPAKATAERRGFCTRGCEKVLEKKHGLHKKDATFAARTAKLRAFHAEHSALLVSTPGADLPEATAARAKEIARLRQAAIEDFIAVNEFGGDVAATLRGLGPGEDVEFLFQGKPADGRWIGPPTGRVVARFELDTDHPDGAVRVPG